MQAKGFKILGICSENFQTREWARRHGVKAYSSYGNFEKNIYEEQFDFLFSIVNRKIISDRIVKQASSFSINYHDSFLPRYAGVHSTSWAILNGERTHGVTWHVMDSGIDSGDVLKQKIINLSNSETAASLNFKCHQNAVELFNELIDDVLNGSLVKKKQNLSLRTYNGMYEKPYFSGIINWSSSIDYIDRLNRATQLGNTVNRFCLCNFIFHGELFHAYRIEFERFSTSIKPGKILKKTKTGMTVSAINGLVILDEIVDMRGVPWVCKKVNFDSFNLNENHEDIISKKLRISAKYEDFWVEKLKDYNPLHLQKILPYGEVRERKFKLEKIDSSKLVFEKKEYYCASVFLAYLFVINNHSPYSVVIKEIDETDENSIFFSNNKPLNISLNSSTPLYNCLELLTSNLKRTNKLSCFPRDIFLRRGELSELLNFDFETIPIIITFNKSRIKKRLRGSYILWADFSNNTITLNIGKKYSEQSRLLDILTIERGIRLLHKHTHSNHLLSLSEAIIFDENENNKLIKFSTGPHLELSYTLIDKLFRDIVHKFKNKCSVIEGNITYSYGDIEKKAKNLVSHFLVLGIRPGDFVPVIMDSGYNYIASILALIKMRAIYVPIDSDLPSKMIQYILKDVNAKYTITDKKNHSALYEHSGITALSVEDLKPIKKSKLRQIECKFKDIAACVMYTSGSTGVPKGVVLTHKNIISMAMNKHILHISSSDKIAQASNCSFDSSTFEIWCSLLNGSTLVIVKRNIFLSPDSFFDFIKDKGITIQFFTPTLFNFYVSERPQVFKHIENVVLGGEQPNGSLCKYLLTSSYAPKSIFNCYGPTETTAFVSAKKMSISDIERYGNVTAGKPISNTKIYILNKYMKFVPIGAVGEIYIAGDGVALGYKDRELSKSKFIKFNKTSEIIYKTGDQARWLTNGEIEFLGRSDNQMKIRGYRVELDEIKLKILSVSEISDVHIAYEKTLRDQIQLISFVTVKTNKSTPGSIKEKLLTVLPVYMVPTKIIIVKEFPMTHSGKVDTKKLLEIASAKGNEYEFNESTTNENLTTIINVIQTILKVESIKPSDNFFELGGDSITAMYVSSELYKKDIILKTSDIFKCHQISDIEKIAKHKDDILIKVNYKKLLPTPIQEWFFSTIKNDNSQFIQMYSGYIDKNINIEVLVKAFNFYFDRPVFSVRYRKISDNWSSFSSNKKNNLNVEIMKKSLLDLRSLSRKIDITKGPVSMLVLNSDVSGVWRLNLLINHLYVDGVSWRIIIDQVNSIYKDLVDYRFPKLSDDFSSLKNWSNKLHQLSNSKAIKAEIPFWLSKFKNKEKIDPDYQRIKAVEKDKAVLKYEVNKPLSNQIVRIKKLQPAISTQIILISSLLLSYKHWNKKNHILFDLEGHGREELEGVSSPINTVGWFTAIYPMSFDLSLFGKISYLECLQAVKSSLSEVPGGGIGYGLLHYLTKENNVIKKLKRPEIGFNYLGNLDYGQNEKTFIKPSYQPISLINGKSNSLPHLIDIMCWVSQGALKFEWDYSSKHFNKSDMQNWIRIYQFYLEKIVEYLYSNKLPLLKPDYPLLNLSQQELSTISKHYDSIEKIYPITPIQMGLLYHVINQQTNDTYFIQHQFDIRSKNGTKSIIKAWNKVFEFYPILRSIFLWEGLSEPIQILSKKTIIPINFHDLTTVSLEDRKKYIFEFIRMDRSRPFNLSKESCIRVTLLKVGKERYHCILSCHHILIDGWSINLILRKFLERCGDVNSVDIKNNYCVAPEYDEYINWLKIQDVNKSKKYWIKELSGFNKINDFKVKRTIFKSKEKDRYVQKEYLVSDKLKNKIDNFIVENKVTLNTLVQTAWIYLVNLYSQDTDITIGVTMSLRPSSIVNIDEVVGLLINTTPFRIKLSTKRTIKNDLHSVQIKMSSVLEHGYCSLAEIQSWSNITAGKSLFETLLVFENIPAFNLEASNVSIENIFIRDTTHYPITFLVVPGAKVQLKIVYDTTQFDDGIIKNIFIQFERILSGIISESSSNYLEIEHDNCTDIYRQKPIYGELKKYKHKSILDLFEVSVRKYSDSIAVVDEQGSLTYKSLNTLSNQLAHYLVSHKFRKGELVGVALSRNRWIIITFLAILKAGGGYVPIDPSYPKKRVEYMLENSGSKILISDDTVLNELKEQLMNVEIIRKINILNLNKIESMLPSYSTCNPRNIILPLSLSYVIYTSGSTGKPKGVMISHENLLNVLADVKERFQIVPEDRWLAVASISFDISGAELYVPLLSGACCVLANSSVASNGRLTSELITKHKISILQATPVTWKLLLAENWKSANGFKAICTGEALSADLARKIIHACGGVWNMYGPTETAIWATGTYINDETIDTPIVSIGKALNNTELLVLDEKGRSVFLGMIGELYIGGSGVSQGYWKEKKLTRERFIKNPFQKNRSKIYSTGDLVRCMSDGGLEFVGRVDHQIKMNGLRIELSAIEARLLEHPNVDEAVVVSRKQENTSMLIAYVVLKNKNTLNFYNIIDFLAEDFPIYMLPTQILELSALPTSPSGKVDRSALIVHEPLVSFGDKKPPHSSIEKSLFEIWVNLLKRNDFGVNENFFDLGGHSILSIQLISNIKKVFNVVVQVRSLFEFSDIAKLARLVEKLSLGNDENIKKAANLHETKKIDNSFIIPLQTKGDKTPLFLIHPVGGTIFWYLPLAKHILDRPLYAIQDPGIESRETLFDSLEEMASYYLDAIRKIQPKGPYLLGGASMGANIAVEITNQLEANGEFVSFLTLLDGWAIYPQKLRNKSWLKKIMLNQRKIIRHQLQLAGIDLKDEWFNIQWHRSQILAKHESPVISSEITLFKAREIVSVFKEYDVASNYWAGNSSKPIKVHLVPGNHETMFHEPNISELGNILQESLEDIE